MSKPLPPVQGRGGGELGGLRIIPEAMGEAFVWKSYYGQRAFNLDVTGPTSRKGEQARGRETVTGREKSYRWKKARC